MRFPKFRDFRGDLLLGLGKAVVRTAKPRPDRFGRSNAGLAQRYAEGGEGVDYTTLVHRVISRRHTVGFKRVWMRGVSEEHIKCDT